MESFDRSVVILDRSMRDERCASVRNRRSFLRRHWQLLAGCSPTALDARILGLDSRCRLCLTRTSALRNQKLPPQYGSVRRVSGRYNFPS
jgi:hypothetical protein